jgi:hypothetical protein
MNQIAINKNQGTTSRLLKKVVSKAAAKSKPEAYPQGYVEDFDEARTKLAAFFSNLLELQLALHHHHTLPPHFNFLNDSVGRIHLDENARGPLDLIALFRDDL